MKYIQIFITKSINFCYFSKCIKIVIFHNILKINLDFYDQKKIFLNFHILSLQKDELIKRKKEISAGKYAINKIISNRNVILLCANRFLGKTKLFIAVFGDSKYCACRMPFDLFIFISLQNVPHNFYRSDN